MGLAHLCGAIYVSTGGTRVVFWGRTNFHPRFAHECVFIMSSEDKSAVYRGDKNLNSSSTHTIDWDPKDEEYALSKP